MAQYISLWSVQQASITSQSAWQFANIKSNIDPDCFTWCTQLNNVSMNATNSELTQSICILKSPNMNNFTVKSTTGLRQQQMSFLKSVCERFGYLYNITTWKYPFCAWQPNWIHMTGNAFLILSCCAWQPKWIHMTGNAILLLSEHESILLHTKQVHDEAYLLILFLCRLT